MTLKERYAGVISWFEEHMPAAGSELAYGSPYELLVAVILSAQCTDKRVNMTTPALFEAFPTPQAMAAATPEQIYPYIKSISYPNNKAKNLAGMARMLCEEFGGEVPSDLKELQRLPGVGRKTANVVGAVIWQKEVMPVDTHVFRVSNRIGLTNRSKTPLQTELTLEKQIPSHLLPTAHHWLILHGRYVCTARAPKCAECGISTWCRKYAEDNKLKPNDYEAVLPCDSRLRSVCRDSCGRLVYQGCDRRRRRWLRRRAGGESRYGRHPAAQLLVERGVCDTFARFRPALRRVSRRRAYAYENQRPGQEVP